MMRQFNLRQMFVSTGWICVALFVFRRPIVELFDGYVVLDCFLNGFRHLPWMFGYEVEYVDAVKPEGVLIPFGLYVVNAIALAVGFLVSGAIHIVVGIQIYKLYRPQNRPAKLFPEFFAIPIDAYR